MKNYALNLKDLKLTFNNQLVIFLFNRYISYVLLFIRGLLIARFLGPYFFGIWGFSTLILQYLSYSNIGINYAITVQLSTKTNNEERERDRIASTALSSMFFIGIILLILGALLYFCGWIPFSRFNFPNYWLVIILITIASNIQQVLINIFRVKKNILRIAITEFVTALLLFISVFVDKNSSLINIQLITILCTSLISIFLMSYKLPIKFSLRFDKLIFLDQLKLGIPLLIYNLSFTLINLSSTSIVSAFYSVEILGFFTLANSISSATLLGLQSIGWAFYPQVLTNTSADITNQGKYQIVGKINTLYATSCFILTIFVVLILPAIFLVLPEYKIASPVIIILVISQAILSASYGFNALAVSNQKQKNIAIIGISVVIVITLLSLCVPILHMDKIWIAIVVLVGSFIYSFLQIRLGTQLLQINENLLREFLKLYPIGVLCSFFLLIISSFTKYSFLLSVFALGIYLFFNRKNNKIIFNFIKTKIVVKVKQYE